VINEQSIETIQFVNSGSEYGFNEYVYEGYSVISELIGGPYKLIIERNKEKTRSWLNRRKVQIDFWSFGFQWFRDQKENGIEVCKQIENRWRYFEWKC